MLAGTGDVVTMETVAAANILFADEGTATTPFDMVMRNQASRYHLVIDALNAARRTPTGASELKAWCEQRLLRDERYVVEHLQDMPEVRDRSLGDRAEQG
ncbi:hypothetical protein [Nonomuraea sp. NPDC003709]|uniref:phosphoketolase family protein n=1 Tax=Nonomuraea sp. NPDC003709 TaxID=3154450 RepID=UPI0033B86C16